jgi:circadian clock protein KaiB
VPRKRKHRGARAVAAKLVVMRLYVANNAPNSVRAVANLAAICREYLQDKFTLEIIDVLEHPLRALADGILVTPSLAKVSPLPPAKIVGDLGDRSSVLHALGVKE